MREVVCRKPKRMQSHGLLFGFGISLCGARAQVGSVALLTLNLMVGQAIRGNRTGCWRPDVTRVQRSAVAPKAVTFTQRRRGRIRLLRHHLCRFHHAPPTTVCGVLSLSEAPARLGITRETSEAMIDAGKVAALPASYTHGSDARPDVTSAVKFLAFARPRPRPSDGTDVRAVRSAAFPAGQRWSCKCPRSMDSTRDHRESLARRGTADRRLRTLP